MMAEKAHQFEEKLKSIYNTNEPYFKDQKIDLQTFLNQVPKEIIYVNNSPVNGISFDMLKNEEKLDFKDEILKDIAEAYSTVYEN